MSAPHTLPYTVAQQKSFISADFNSTLMSQFLFGIYTGVFAATIYIYWHREDRAFPKASVVIGSITVLYGATAIYVPLTWFYTNVLLCTNGTTRLQMFIESVSEALPTGVIMVINLTAGFGFVFADGLLVWRCYHACGHSLRHSLLPIALFIVETGLVVSSMVYICLLDAKPELVSPRTSQISSRLSAARFISVAVTSLVATFMICRQIYGHTEPGSKARRRYRRVIDTLIQSSGVYPVTVVFLAILDILASHIEKLSDEFTVNAIEHYVSAVAEIFSVAAFGASSSGSTVNRRTEDVEGKGNLSPIEAGKDEGQEIIQITRVRNPEDHFRDSESIILLPMGNAFALLINIKKSEKPTPGLFMPNRLDPVIGLRSFTHPIVIERSRSSTVRLPARLLSKVDQVVLRWTSMRGFMHEQEGRREAGLINKGGIFVILVPVLAAMTFYALGLAWVAETTFIDGPGRIFYSSMYLPVDWHVGRRVGHRTRDVMDNGGRVQIIWVASSVHRMALTGKKLDTDLDLWFGPGLRNVAAVGIRWFRYVCDADHEYRAQFIHHEVEKDGSRKKNTREGQGCLLARLHRQQYSSSTGDSSAGVGRTRAGDKGDEGEEDLEERIAWCQEMERLGMAGVAIIVCDDTHNGNNIGRNSCSKPGSDESDLATSVSATKLPAADGVQRLRVSSCLLSSSPKRIPRLSCCLYPNRIIQVWSTTIAITMKDSNSKRGYSVSCFT
ncbi:hypothetical protein CPC08DRAFT_730290 [Agrocybe pediades]|nr:hypothetical protein CPC08DRAFT_730290 [Agrocybe pediades]